MALHYGDSKDITLLGPRTTESLEHTFLAHITSLQRPKKPVMNI